MKYVMYGICSILIIVLIVLTLLTIEDRRTRENELHHALRLALWEASDALFVQGKYTVDSEQELVADVTSLLVEQLHTKDENQTLRVEVVGVDVKKGLLSVRVEETYTHPNGRKGTIAAEATVVLEQEAKKELYEIAYLLPEDAIKRAKDEKMDLPMEYKRYRQEEGAHLMVPLNPPDIGTLHFLYWEDEDGNIYHTEELSSMTVDTSHTFFARYQEEDV